MKRNLFENFIVRSGTGRQFNIMDVSPTDEEAEKEKRMSYCKRVIISQEITHQK
jgi:hypothetical protein